MFKRNLHRISLLFLDALLVAFAFGFAYELALQFQFHREAEYLQQYIHLIGFIILLRIVLFSFFNLYKGLLRYASITELIAIFLSVSVGTAVIGLFNLLCNYIPHLWHLPLHPDGHLLRIPWPVWVIDWLLTIMLIGGMRFSRRLLLTAGLRIGREARRVLIIGAGDLGESVARDMLKNPQQGYRPVGFIDKEPEKIGRRIHNLQVMGDLSYLHDAIERWAIDELVIAIPGATPTELNEIITECKKAPVGFKIIPGMRDVMEGKVSVSQLRPVEIEDLLGREPVKLELPKEKNYIKDEVALITGAGGSIGSELGRQLINYQPKQLLLFGKGENSLYEIANELKYEFGATEVSLIIGDIRDERKLDHTFRTYQPTILFHAAAHKHVHFMEEHPDEAVKNNVLGTYYPAIMAHRYGVKKFILISTDKAVRPTSVMGATKRVAEMIAYSLAQQSATEFLAVRFGNVLGSRGSVIPLFKRQIEHGGPVTVTHPEVTRYFMTIPEAVSLVIYTGAIGQKGDLFILDMGQPVKIFDLANTLITLAGLEPAVDIKVKFIGLRPGEKLKEELLTQEEGLRKTEVDKILAVRTTTWDWDKLKQYIFKLKEAAEAGNSQQIRQLLKSLVPDYQPADLR